MKYKITTLKNGLRIITVPMKDTQTATMVVLVGTGSRYESKKEAGLAHFLEHMLLKGTKKRPNWSDISKEIDAVGGDHNAFTSKDVTGYYAKSDAKHLNLIMDVIADIYLNSTINSEEIKKECGAIIQEMKMYEDDPKRKVGDIFESLLYGNNPLGRDIVGYERTLKSFKRDDFLKYLNRSYLSNNTVVCVAGRFSEKKIISSLKKYFDRMKRGGFAKFLKIKEKQKKPAARIKFKEIEQTVLVLGNRAYHENHKDRFALSLIATILGGNASSRLFSEIRERRGLAYYIRTGVESFSDCGYLATQAGIEHKNLEKVVKIISEELKRMATDKVPREELQRAKDYIKGSSVMGLEASDSVAMLFADQSVRRKKILTPNEIFSHIDKVTQNDILRVAKDIFKTETLNLAIIGPHKNKAKLEKLLKI